MCECGSGVLKTATEYAFPSFWWIIQLQPIFKDIRISRTVGLNTVQLRAHHLPRTLSSNSVGSQGSGITQLNLFLFPFCTRMTAFPTRNNMTQNPFLLKPWPWGPSPVTWNDDVSESQHGKVISIQALLQKVLGKYHCTGRKGCEKLAEPNPVLDASTTPLLLDGEGRRGGQALGQSLHLEAKAVRRIQN